MIKSNNNHQVSSTSKMVKAFNDKVNFISIGICTKNNHKLLNKCLKSINNLVIPNNLKVEIVVVDQSDNQLKVDSSIIKRFVFKQLCSNHSGISFARNELFELASGDILFITDDDTIVSNNWITSSLDLFTDNKRVGLIGGKIKQLNKTPRPFKNTLKELGYNKNFWPYALLDLGKKVIAIDKDTHYPCFANMAIRKKVYKNIKIDTDFGNQERFFKIFGGEDPAFVEEVKKTYSLLYNPNMLVWHYIKPHKFSKKYFIWRYFEWGKERALLKTKYNIPFNIAFNQLFKNIINLIRNIKNGRTYLNELLYIVLALSFSSTIFFFKISNISKKS